MSANLPIDNWQDLRLSRRTGHPNSGHYPALWEATADEADGKITAKRIDVDGEFVGDEVTFTTLAE